MINDYKSKKHSLNPLIIIIILFGVLTSNFILNAKFSNTIHFRSNINTIGSRDTFLIESDDTINIRLVDPQNNSINKGGMVIDIEFQDKNGSIVEPVTKKFRWDYASNFEAILRPLPYADGSHILEIQVESASGIWSFAKYQFYSDNEPFEVTLNDLENQTYQPGGKDVILWQTTYPSGTLNSIVLSDVHNDNDMDVFVGGASRRVYVFDGRDGTPAGLSTELSSEIKVIENIDNDSIVVGLSDGTIQILRNSDLSSTWSNSSMTSSVINIKNDYVSENIIVLQSNVLRSFNYTGYFNWNVSFENELQSTLLIGNVMGNTQNEIITINASSHIKIFNSSNGNLITQFQLPTVIVSHAISYEELLFGFDDGYVRKYNASNGDMLFSQEIFSGAIIYDLKINKDYLYGSTSNGILFKSNITNGQLLYSKDISNSFIKHFQVFDFDNNTIDECVVFDGLNQIKNHNCQRGEDYWNYTSLSSLIMNTAIGDLNNNTFINIVGYTGTSKVIMFDPRGMIPKGVVAWTNVSFSFSDEICGTKPLLSYYSWDNQPNQTYLGHIPELSGVHSLDIWIYDNASNVIHQYYEFYSFLNIRLNSPMNNTHAQSSTLINHTFSEEPLEVLYKWDSSDFTVVTPTLPLSEGTHELFILVTDQSYNSLSFYYCFTTDDTPIASIDLISPSNNTIVEGGEEISIQFSETPDLQFYSWNGQENETVVGTIPIPSDTHILKVFVADEARNWATVTYIFYTKIQITLVSHLNNTVIEPNAKLNFTFGEIPDSYQYSIDKAPFIITTGTSNSTTIVMPSDSRTHSLLIRVNDSVNGRWNEELYVFSVKIMINITSHPNGGYAETGDLVIIEFSDEPTTKYFSWDGKINSSKDPVVPAPDGPHYLDIYLGNIEGEFWHYHLDLNVDTNLIDILLLNPINNTRINSWVNITIDFSEPPHSIIYQWDNQTQIDFLSPPPSNNSGHWLNVTVLDAAGNNNSKIFYWIVDDIPINTTIIGHESNTTYFSGEIVNVSFNGETPLLVWYGWNNSDSYSPVLQPVPWGNGTHVLNITTTDGLNWNTQLFNISTIDLPPILSVIDCNKSHQSNVKLSLSVNEELAENYHYWNNGPKIASLDVITPPTEGTHNLTIFAKDLGGSFSYYSVLITVDNTPIKIVSVKPKNNSVVNGGETIFIEFSEIPYSITFAWNNGLRMVNVTTIPVETGRHVLNIRAYDEAGNLLDVNIKFKVESIQARTAPYIIAIIVGLSLILTAIIWKWQLITKKLSPFFNKIRPPKKKSG